MGILLLFPLSCLFCIFYTFIGFIFLGSNNIQQPKSDEENPETHQLLLQTDKENDHDGLYIFERHVQDKNNSLNLDSSFFCIFAQ